MNCPVVGVKVYFAADSLDFDTRGGRLLADIQMALAADYSRNLSIEAKKGLYGRLKQGIYPFRAPIGYLNNGGGKLKTIDPAKALLVKELFRLYLTGDYSITSLTAEMQGRGLKGNGGRPVVRRNVATILNLPFYCGQMKVLDKLYDGKHERLISVADWRRIQRIKGNRYAKKSTKHGHLFRGLITCGDCQRILTGEKQKSRVYYRCHTKKCPGKGMREDRLETAILQKLKQLEISEKDRISLETEMRTWNEGNQRKDIQKSLRLRISEAKSKQDRLTDLLVDGAIDNEAFALRKDNLTFEVGQLNEELVGIENQRLSEVEMAEVMELVVSISTVYQKADPTRKRQLLKNSFQSMCVGSGKLVVVRTGLSVGQFKAITGSVRENDALFTESPG